jgi:hypothetical protein
MMFRNLCDVTLPDYNEQCSNEWELRGTVLARPNELQPALRFTLVEKGVPETVEINRDMTVDGYSVAGERLSSFDVNVPVEVSAKVTSIPYPASEVSVLVSYRTYMPGDDPDDEWYTLGETDVFSFAEKTYSQDIKAYFNAAAMNHLPEGRSWALIDLKIELFLGGVRKDVMFLNQWATLSDGEIGAAVGTVLGGGPDLDFDSDSGQCDRTGELFSEDTFTCSVDEDYQGHLSFKLKRDKDQDGNELATGSSRLVFDHTGTSDDVGGLLVRYSRSSTGSGDAPTRIEAGWDPYDTAEPSTTFDLYQDTEIRANNQWRVYLWKGNSGPLAAYSLNDLLKADDSNPAGARKVALELAVDRACIGPDDGCDSYPEHRLDLVQAWTDDGATPVIKVKPTDIVDLDADTVLPETVAQNDVTPINLGLSVYNGGTGDIVIGPGLVGELTYPDGSSIGLLLTASTNIPERKSVDLDLMYWTPTDIGKHTFLIDLGVDDNQASGLLSQSVTVASYDLGLELIIDRDSGEELTEITEGDVVDVGLRVVNNGSADMTLSPSDFIPFSFPGGTLSFYEIDIAAGETVDIDLRIDGSSTWQPSEPGSYTFTMELVHPDDQSSENNTLLNPTVIVNQRCTANLGLPTAVTE